MAESGYDPRAWATPTDTPTVHPDAGRPGGTPTRTRRDPIALLVGLVCLAVAVSR